MVVGWGYDLARFNLQKAGVMFCQIVGFQETLRWQKRQTDRLDYNEASGLDAMTKSTSQRQRWPDGSLRMAKGSPGNLDIEDSRRRRHVRYRRGFRVAVESGTTTGNPTGISGLCRFHYDLFLLSPGLATIALGLILAVLIPNAPLASMSFFAAAGLQRSLASSSSISGVSVSIPLSS